MTPDARQEDLLGEVDPPHPAVRRAREPQEHLEVAEREPVVGDELGVQLPRHGGMRAEQRDERLDAR